MRGVYNHSNILQPLSHCFTSYCLRCLMWNLS